MFLRRTPHTRWQKILKTLWPAMGMMRLLRYYQHRIGRLSGTPYYIASGFAAGVAVSFTPFIGFHLMLAAALTWALGGSLVAMVLGTVMAGNPWTFPFIWLVTYKLGRVLLGEHGTRAASSALKHTFTFSDLLEKPLELLLPMTLGSIPFFILSGAASFYFVRQLIKSYKEARHRRIYKQHKSY